MWFSALFSRRPRRSQRLVGRRPPASYQPKVKALEERWLLSTFQWTGLGAASLWSDGNNWKNLSAVGQPAGVPESGDSLRFPAGAARLVNTDDLAGRTFSALEISGSGYNLQSAAGVQLQVGSGGITASNGSGTNTIKATVNLASSQIISVTNPGIALTFGGVLTGEGGVFKAGAGRIIVTANNNYGGLTTVSAGELEVKAPQALGKTTATGETLVSSGATLIIDSGASRGVEQLQLNGPGLNREGALVLTGTNTWAGPVILASDAHIAVAASATLTGAVSGPGGLSKDGAGKLILAGTSTNTYTGDTLISKGVINIRKASALGTSTDGTPTVTSVAGGAGLEIEGSFAVSAESLNLAGIGPGGAGALHVISGNDAWNGLVSLSGNVTIATGDAASLAVEGEISGTFGGFTKTGVGRLILNGANNYRGTTTVRQGVVRVGNNSALGGLPNLPPPVTVVRTGAALEVAPGPTGAPLTLSVPLILNGTGIANTGVLRNLRGVNTWLGPITLNSSSFIGVDQDVLTIAGVMNSGGDATTTLTKVGAAGRLTLTQNNPSLLGEIFVTQGELEVDSSGALGDPASPTTVLSNATLLIGRNAVLGEPLNLAGKVAAASQNTAIGVCTGTITLIGDAALSSGFGGVPLTVAGKITGIGNLTYLGDVTLAGNTVNDYVGNTTVFSAAQSTSAGTLALHLDKPTGVTAIPTGTLTIDDNSIVVYDQNFVTNGSGQIFPTTDVVISPRALLDLNGSRNTIHNLTLNDGTAESGTGTLTITGDISVPGEVDGGGFIHGSLSLGDVSHTITVNNGADGHDLIIDAAIHSTSSGGGFVKAGPGDLQLRGDNDYAGPTQINAGIVEMHTSTALGLATTIGSTTVADGAVLVIFNPINSAEPLTLAGSGVANSRFFEQSGALLKSNQFDTSNTAVLSGQITLAGNATVRVDATETLRLDGRITGPGGLTKTADGTLLMNGPSLGDVTVQGGLLGGTSAVPNIVANGGTIAPGSSGPGVLSASQNVTLNSEAAFEVDLDGSTTPGTDFDQLAVSGAVALNNAALVIDPGVVAFGVPLAVIHASGLVTGHFVDPDTGTVLATGDTIIAKTGQQFVISYGHHDVFLTPQDTAPMFANRSVSSLIDEGGVATLRGTIVEPDPLDAFTLVVNWGDGSAAQTFTFPAGSNGQTVQVSHVYRDNGLYTVNASWHDPLGLGNRADLQVQVSNMPPNVDVGGDEHLSRGGVLNRIGSLTDPGGDTWTATVDYGDGSGPQELKLGRDNTFHLHHKYQTPGSYWVTVWVMDDDGGVGTASFRVFFD